jgi:hypothetical protein
MREAQLKDREDSLPIRDSADMYIRVRLPISEMNPDFGCAVINGKSKLVVPDGFSNLISPPAVLRALEQEPSCFLAGESFSVLRHSFNMGPRLLLPCRAGRQHLVHRLLGEGAEVQVHGVFVDNSGNPVSPMHYDSDRKRTLAYGASFVDSLGVPCTLASDVLSLLGLDGFVVVPDSSSPVWDVTCIGPGLSHDGDTLRLRPGRQASDVDVHPCAVPSARYQVHPVVFASVSESGVSSSAGPGELFLLYRTGASWRLGSGRYEFGELFAPELSHSVGSDRTRGMATPLVSHIERFCPETEAESEGKSVCLAPRLLLHGAKLCSTDITVSIQNLNLAMIDAPPVHRVLQLLALVRSGISGERLVVDDSDDTEVVDAYRVLPALESAHILIGPALDGLSAALRRGLTSLLDSDTLGEALISLMPNGNTNRFRSFRGVMSTSPYKENPLPIALCATIDLVIHDPLSSSKGTSTSTETETETETGAQVSVPLYIEFV